ncbi:MAG: hypothetical protein HQM03_15655 [Magnetococcales bacterium]|nr:hypothetical protein [Magnetococcales bacterium]
MIQIDTAEFQAHLPDYLKSVEEGEIIRLMSRGQVFACLTPEPKSALPLAENTAKPASRFEALRGRAGPGPTTDSVMSMLRGSVIVGDILAPLDEEHAWTGDEDNL